MSSHIGPPATPSEPIILIKMKVRRQDNKIMFACNICAEPEWYVKPGNLRNHLELLHHCSLVSPGGSGPQAHSQGHNLNPDATRFDYYGTNTFNPGSTSSPYTNLEPANMPRNNSIIPQSPSQQSTHHLHHWLSPHMYAPSPSSATEHSMSSIFDGDLIPNSRSPETANYPGGNMHSRL